MELWKIERFCETASSQQLREVEAQLKQMLEAGLLSNTNAQIALQKVREALCLRQLFGER